MIGETVLVNGEPVENVLVEPGNARDASEASLPAGTVVDYTLRFPVSFEGPLHDAKVTVRGTELDTLTHADHWRPMDVFGSWSNPWDMTVLVGRTLGDYTANVTVYSVSAALDALGDPVTTETAVYEGAAQARNTYGSEENGGATVTDSRETWYFVIPWQPSFAGLRPKSTYVMYGGARYDAVSLKNVDEKSETLSIEAVRHG